MCRISPFRCPKGTIFRATSLQQLGLEFHFSLNHGDMKRSLHRKSNKNVHYPSAQVCFVCTISHLSFFIFCLYISHSKCQLRWQKAKIATGKFRSCQINKKNPVSVEVQPITNRSLRSKMCQMLLFSFR